MLVTRSTLLAVDQRGAERGEGRESLFASNIAHVHMHLNAPFYLWCVVYACLCISSPLVCTFSNACCRSVCLPLNGKPRRLSVWFQAVGSVRGGNGGKSHRHDIRPQTEGMLFAVNCGRAALNRATRSERARRLACCLLMNLHLPPLGGGVVLYCPLPAGACT